MKASRHNLYHRFLKLLRQNNIYNKKFLLAVSGGIDSISLLSLMIEVQRPLQLNLAVAYVHHGLNKKTYRDDAWAHIYSLCQGWNIPFYYNIPQIQKCQSEESLRKLRYNFLRKWQKKIKADDLVLAHTADDLLETRLIRLIRGTGAQGLLSMHFLKDSTLRPFIFFTKSEIKNYALSQHLSWIEDPSNKQTDFFRNWIRNTWLKQIEKRQKGAIRNLSRSLELVCEEINFHKNSLPFILTDNGLDKIKFLKLSSTEQKKTLAQYMKLFHLKNYSQNHIQEVLKYLRSNTKKKTFYLLKKKWLIEKKFFKIQNKSNSPF